MYLRILPHVSSLLIKKQQKQIMFKYVTEQALEFKRNFYLYLSLLKCKKTAILRASRKELWIKDTYVN